MTNNKAIPSNEQLVERFRGGDEQAFALLEERLMPLVEQQVLQTKCNGSYNDDLMQEGRLALLRAAEAFRPDGGASFKTFARLCVRRRLWNVAELLKSPETPQDNESLLSQLDKEAVPFDPGDRLLDFEAETALLARLRQSLSDLEYRVMVLHVSAYSYEEIATLLNTSPKSVDNALCRARRKLSRLI